MLESNRVNANKRVKKTNVRSSNVYGQTIISNTDTHEKRAITDRYKLRNKKTYSKGKVNANSGKFNTY